MVILTMIFISVYWLLVTGYWLYVVRYQYVRVNLLQLGSSVVVHVYQL